MKDVAISSFCIDYSHIKRKMSEQNWNRPWTTEEFIKNAEKWSLAGDAALLNTIKHLGEVFNLQNLYELLYNL